MKLYIFRCLARPRMYGATRFETASNLPTDRCSGGWKFYERVELAARGTLRFAVDTGTLRHEVQRNGWYVWDESPPEPRPAVAESKPILPERRLPAESATAASEVAPAPMTKTVLPGAEVAASRQVAVATPPELRAKQNVAKLPARHQVVWFDIPVRDIDRAMRFYSAVLGTQLKKEQAGPGVATAVLPRAQDFIGGCLVQNMDARPSETGPLLYLNTHGRLDEALNAVQRHGGKVLSARHSIAPFGFRAIVLDSEGNRIALHSM